MENGFRYRIYRISQIVRTQCVPKNKQSIENTMTKAEV